MKQGQRYLVRGSSSRCRGLEEKSVCNPNIVLANAIVLKEVLCHRRIVLVDCNKFVNYKRDT